MYVFVEKLALSLLWEVLGIDKGEKDDEKAFVECALFVLDGGGLLRARGV